MKLFKVAAFLKEPHGGNKAGVCIDCEKLSDEEMLQTAKELGFSETAFVLKSDIADYKIRYFTPFHEIDVCGHATIATFNLLRDLSMIKEGKYKIEIKVGILSIDVKNDIVFMEQNSPIFYEEVDFKEIEACFLESNFIDENLKVIIGSTGLKEIFVPVKEVELLHSLHVIKDELLELSVTHKVIGIHLFASNEECDAYSRNFAPIVGIDEESATGTSNAVLGCYFHKFINKKIEYIFRQGYAMESPSEIIVQIREKNDEIIPRVGGCAKSIQ